MEWNATKEEHDLIGLIVSRALAYDIPPLTLKRMDLAMDLEATHCNGCPLDLDKLLTFDDFNFAHDVYGISLHIDRSTGELQDCFVPRCARGE